MNISHWTIELCLKYAERLAVSRRVTVVVAYATVCQSHVGCVAHASVRRMPFVGGQIVVEARHRPTWLASCVRRILRQLMLAVAEKRRADEGARDPGGFEVGGR